MVAKTLDVSQQSIQIEEVEASTLTLTFADAAAKEAAVVETPDQAVAKAERKDGEKDITYTVNRRGRRLYPVPGEVRPE